LKIGKNLNATNRNATSQEPALVFVTQPMKQAPNDAAFIDLVSTLTVFLTGTLAGIVSANGLKSKTKQGENNVSSTQ